MIRRHTISFKHAIDGLLWAVKSQPNYRIHLTLSFLAVSGGFLLQITYPEFLVVVTLIFVGLAIETINTALEKTSDAISKTFDPDIRLAKDIAAGAMLIFAIGAFIIASSIFLPKLLQSFFTIG